MKSSVRSVHREVACQCWYILRSAVQRPSVHHVPLLPADSSCRREPESSLRSGFELPTARKALPGSFAQEREACAAERRTALPRLLSSEAKQCVQENRERQVFSRVTSALLNLSRKEVKKVKSVNRSLLNKYSLINTASGCCFITRFFLDFRAIKQHPEA